MDGSRFDAWTRRHVGLAAGGLAASLAGLVTRNGAEAKKKRKKKKCKKLGAGCNPGGKRKCCKNLKCEEPTALGGNRCCKGLGASCSAEIDCCSGFCFDDECQPDLCKEIGATCSEDNQCCSNICLDSECQPEECTELSEPCTASNQCCSGFCDILGSQTCEPVM